MTDKPDTNFSDSDQDNSRSNYRIAGDYNQVSGDLTGVVVGRGSLHADKIARGDINDGASARDKTREFSELMVSLKKMIIEAQDSGELPDATAKKALTNLVEAAEMIQNEEKPPRQQVIRRLEYVADALDTAVDVFTASGGAASVLLRAAPVASLLIRVARRIF